MALIQPLTLSAELRPNAWCSNGAPTHHQPSVNFWNRRKTTPCLRGNSTRSTRPLRASGSSDNFAVLTGNGRRLLDSRIVVQCGTKHQQLLMTIKTASADLVRRQISLLILRLTDDSRRLCYLLGQRNSYRGEVDHEHQRINGSQIDTSTSLANSSLFR